MNQKRETMADNETIRIQITQRSVFAKRLPLDVILGADLQYGYYDGPRLKRGEKDPHYLVAYHPERIGRGIRVLWNEEEYRDVILDLPLPAAQEEIEDLFAMTERIRHLWTGAVTVNRKPIATNHLDNVRNNLITFNLRFLHGVMRGILNEDGWASLSCAMHRLVVGPQEADEMWAGIYTDKFRDWLHSHQNISVYLPVPRLYMERDSDRTVGIVTLPAGVRVVWENDPSALLRFSDKHGQQVDDWRCALYDTDGKKIVGTVPYERVLKALPQWKKEYFDYGRTLVNPLDTEMLTELMEKNDRPAEG